MVDHGRIGYHGSHELAFARVVVGQKRFGHFVVAAGDARYLGNLRQIKAEYDAVGRSGFAQRVGDNAVANDLNLIF